MSDFSTFDGQFIARPVRDDILAFKLVCPACRRESVETVDWAMVIILLLRQEGTQCIECDPTASEPIPYLLVSRPRLGV